jgi:outer membrane protein assembly factor BamB
VLFRSSYITDSSLTYSSPVVACGRVYIGSFDNKVYCINATMGNLLWSYSTGLYIESSPAFAGGCIYIGSGDSKIYCLNAFTGKFIWSYITGYMVKASPAIASGFVYIGSMDGNVYCLNATTGSYIWSFAIGSGVHCTPVVADGHVYVGSQGNIIYCLDQNTGTIIWGNSYPMYSPEIYTVAFASGCIYLGDNDAGILYCIDAIQGNVLWSYQVNATYYGICTTPAIANGRVYFGSADGTLHCLPMILGTTNPSAPRNFQITVGNRQTVLTWTTPGNNGGRPISGYKVYRGSTSGGETLIATLGVVLTYTNTGLTNGQLYYYYITAVNAYGESAGTQELSAVPGRVPSAPLSFTVTPGINQVVLHWATPASNGGFAITGYRVYCGTTSGGETLLATIGVVLTYSTMSLVNGQPYYFKVCARNKIGRASCRERVSERV